MVTVCYSQEEGTPVMRWRVIVSPSPFRPSLVLGEYRCGLSAWLAAFWQVVVNPCAEAIVQRRCL